MKSLLQTILWADFKASHSWKAHPLTIDGQQISVLERQLPLGRSFLYAPELSLPSTDEKTFNNLANQLGQAAKSAIFFRLELFERLGEANDPVTVALTKAGYRKAFEEVQPEHRQWLDINHDEAAILAQMKEKGRYNIRLAERKGVKARISTDTSDVDIYYDLFQKTAVRDGFAIRSKQYFVDLCQMLFTHNLGELIIAEAEIEGKTVPLAALIITYYDGLASYLYGASSNEYRNLMGPYAAHWQAILSAKKRGCTIYDLIQIAPHDAGEGHKYSRLTQFKQQFGGEAVTLVGSWDYVYKPLEYQMFKLAEQLRRH